MNATNIGIKIEKLRIKRKLSQRNVALHTGISNGTISRIESGTVNPDIDTLNKLAIYFKVSVDYLLAEDNIEFIDLPQHTVKIPVYGTIPAGVPTEMIEDSYIDEYIEIDAEWVKNGAIFFGLKVKGDSMSPSFLDGDTLILKKQHDCDSGNYCAVSVNCTECTFKKVVKKEHGITLQPLNSQFDPVFYTKEEIDSLPITILGVVKEVRRKL